MPLKVQWQLKGVDQEVYLLLIYETGQRPENQIATLGLVLRQTVESGEQVTESLWYWTPNRRSRFLAGCVWPSKGISTTCV